ncbi:phage infection protein-like protein [Bifidobacterium actinocoloniiforme DSM 22766]|uniref:Phage infection protein-like protein n=1 Tax=Bifidobacterium actinocoloniiforme DSM 22766 TaxID=1437605 RepID=A0A086Z2G9_9BIFI|nr:YhgE/Pip domain-containing protein [Bifidobacterium actinocoloniiforme]AKV55713.1 phage infection protein [Bifidobacterium actinocoloniiforme DSM 22766]KFI40719.1 phage infection protein-like protein [Bifidobacterium actinocoloniiforme DSM 22766]
MKSMWELFTGDLKRITSNIVSIIIVIGLVVIPGLFAWFNVAASWDPFSNTKNLKFAVANVDKGYKSDLIPVKVTVGDQVVNELRANSQLDWTFTSKDDAIDGTKSGKYYASVVIPENFSHDMMTFFSADAHHAKLAYYSNEKTNALAPKVTGQGADQVAGQINEMFAKTITGTALSIASQLADEMDRPEAKTMLTRFTGNVDDVAKELSQASAILNNFDSLSQDAQGLMTSSTQMVDSLSDGANQAGRDLQNANHQVSDVSGALDSTAKSLSDALVASSSSYDAVGSSIDSTFQTANHSVADAAAGLNRESQQVSQQADQYQRIRGALVATTGENSVSQRLDAVILQLRQLSSSLSSTAANVSNRNAQSAQQRQQIKDLAAQAKASISGVSSDFNTKLRPQIKQIASSVNATTATLGSASSQLKSTLSGLRTDTSAVNKDMADVNDMLSSMSATMAKTSDRLTDFTGKLNAALTSGDMDTVRRILGSNDPETLAATLAAPVKLSRTTLYPVQSFGAALTPFYTLIPLWVGSLLMAVTLKITVSRRTREALGDPKPHQLFLGHFGVFAVISLLQSTFSCAGSLLFIRVHAAHPWLFMATGWISGLVYAFFIYTLVASFGNVGKAIGVIYLVMQISGSGGAYPLQVLPGFVSAVNPYLPVSHSIQAMRAAIAGIYMNDYWIEISKLLLFVPPMILLGLVLRKPLVKFNQWYVSKIEATKLME